MADDFSHHERGRRLGVQPPDETQASTEELLPAAEPERDRDRCGFAVLGARASR